MSVVAGECTIRKKGYYMSDHALLHLLNEVGKNYKMPDLKSILSSFSQRV